MLTPEQIKNLKPGDPIIIHGNFESLHADGDINYKAAYTGPDDRITYSYRAVHPHCASLPESQTVEITLTPTPKYDPCRLFKEGDKVRPVQRYGRDPDDGAPVNVICEVVEDERINGTVAILARKNGGSVRFRVTALYLELVTPVEELEPYVVRLATPDGVEEWHVEPRNNNLALVAVFGHRHPHAKEAAEAECKRLNEEYRKERQ